MLALLAVLPACRNSAKANPGDDAAVAKVVHPPRVARPGETLADIEKSKVSLAIIKDRDEANPVTATMMLRDGAVAIDGPNGSTARLSIDVMTFDTTIPIRNERVKKFFFETSGIGWDTIELVIPKIPDEVVKSLKDTRAVTKAKVTADVKLHGKSKQLELTVDAGYRPDGSLWVKSSGPFQAKASDFGLTDNLQRLSSICMHDSIDDGVKVDVALEFPAAAK
ncbi:MAG: YceI family protein [Deltaproteobacteria bacterium]|nr:YceI family protein [Deltaproteobacteria bacterium]